MRVFQILVTLVKGDAIGNYTLMLNEIIKENGYMTEIFAENIGLNISEKFVNKISELPKLKADDIIIYHLCEKSSINKLIKNLNCKKICIYHNSTPSQFFSWLDYNQGVHQEESRREIRNLKNIFDYCFADSEYNRQDLISMGYDAEKIDVLPIEINYSDYEKKADASIISQYDDDYTNIIFVGRVAPNKKHEDIIRIFAHYKQNINKKSRLIFAGNIFSENYINYLYEYRDHIMVEDVIFLGHITFSEILGVYSVGDIFLCMSEHEGFCVPLIEAMFFKVPIIAYDSSAIGETLGDSGVLVETKNPSYISLIINEIMNDKVFKDKIIENQSKRLEKFKSNKLQDLFKTKIEKIILGE